MDNVFFFPISVNHFHLWLNDYSMLPRTRPYYMNRNYCRSCFQRDHRRTAWGGSRSAEELVLYPVFSGILVHHKINQSVCFQSFQNITHTKTRSHGPHAQGTPSFIDVSIEKIIFLGLYQRTDGVPGDGDSHTHQFPDRKSTR